MAKKPVKKNEIVLDEVPEQPVSEADLPKQLIVEHKVSGMRYTVSRKHYLANRSDLKLV